MADNNEQNPWTRPGWIISAVVVAVVLVLGIVITITTARGGGDSPAPTGAPSTSGPVGAPTSGSSVDPADESVCGLDGVELVGTLAEAPEAEWAYAGTTAYPTSSKYGPADVQDNGVRGCFQHTPTGALFMAANMAAGPADTTMASQWADYFVAPGPFRDELVDTGDPADAGADTTGTRMEIRGFRILDYSGSTARVELGVAYLGNGNEATASIVYELVWHDGDWKFSSETSTPFDFAEVPSLTGYVPWSAP